MPLRDGTRSGFVGKDFRWVIAPKYQHAGEFADGLALIATERKWGYVDRSGNEIVPPKYDSVWQFSEGVGRTRVDTPPAETSMTMEGPRKVYRYQFGFVDTHGREVIRPRFQSATDFQQGRAFVIPAESGKWAIFDKQGTLLHRPEYDQVEGFRQGLAAARLGGKWGYIDFEGSWIIAPQFNNGDDFWHGLARVAWNEGYGYIDRTGRSIWKATTQNEIK
jgi:hypothetical protein